MGISYWIDSGWAEGELSDQRMEDWVVDTKCKQTKILVVQAKSSLLMVEAVEQPSQSP